MLLLLLLDLWVFRSNWGQLVMKYPPAGLHAVEASRVSSFFPALRAAIDRAVWSSKMPLANAPASLNLLDGTVRCLVLLFTLFFLGFLNDAKGTLLTALKKSLGSFGCWI